MRILFQGDSITDAFRRPDEMNPAFQCGNGYAFLLASRLAFEYPGASLEFINRGVVGERVPDLLKRWQSDAVDLKPDLISILVGVNDVNSRIKKNLPFDAAAFKAKYWELLTPLQASNPEVKIVMLEPFLLPVGKVTIAWQKQLSPCQDMIREIAEDAGARFVPLQREFDKACDRAPADFWIWDGIHPTHAGFELIAQAWLRSTADLLNFSYPLCFESDCQTRRFFRSPVMADSFQPRLAESRLS